MALELDIQAYAAIQFGAAGNYIPIPAEAGGLSATDDPNVQKVYLSAGAGFEACNWFRGLYQPAVAISTAPHKTWFTAANLQVMFTTKTNGLLGSLGRVAYRCGSGVNADQVMGTFTGCYVPSMTIAGGGNGTPVAVQFGLLPSGAVYESPPSTPHYPAYGADMAAYPTGSTGFFLSEGVAINTGTIDGVESWSLTILNGLRPSTALPNAAVPLATANVMPDRYLNGPIGFVFNLVQRSGSSYVDNALNATNEFTINLKSAETAAPSQASVTFTIYGLKPRKTGAFTGGNLTLIPRSYTNIAPDTATASLAIA